MNPSPMGFCIVDARSDEAGMLGLECGLCLVEAHHLGWANEGKIVRIEEQHDHFGTDTRQAQMANLVVKSTGQIEGRRRVTRFQHLTTVVVSQSPAKPTESRKSGKLWP